MNPQKQRTQFDFVDQKPMHHSYTRKKHGMFHTKIKERLPQDETHLENGVKFVRIKPQSDFQHTHILGSNIME